MRPLDMLMQEEMVSCPACNRLYPGDTFQSCPFCYVRDMHVGLLTWHGQNECPTCGDPHEISCPDCGKEYHKGDTYCTKCGYIRAGNEGGAY